MNLETKMFNQKIEMIEVKKLRHIEGFSLKKVKWLKDKILIDNVWKKPLAIDKEHFLVLDGQHRMEVALSIGLRHVPAIKFDYAMIKVVSLRKNHRFNWEMVVKKALLGDIYPYKTVKHYFDAEFPLCQYSLKELM
jgi:L-serine kinase (ADP)